MSTNLGIASVERTYSKFVSGTFGPGVTFIGSRKDYWFPNTDPCIHVRTWLTVKTTDDVGDKHSGAHDLCCGITARGKSYTNGVKFLGSRYDRLLGWM